MAVEVSPLTSLAVYIRRAETPILIRCAVACKELGEEEVAAFAVNIFASVRTPVFGASGFSFEDASVTVLCGS